MNGMPGTWFSVAIFWKEYRQLRSFWLAMAVLTVLFECLAHFATAGWGVTPVYWVALSLPAFYALGCGATMFAAEHEAGTYQMLRALPIRAETNYVSKLAFTLVSVPALYAVAWAAAALISGFRLPPADPFRAAWGLFGFASFELLVWSMLFSLLMRHPLRAAVLGAMGALSVLYFAADRSAPFLGGTYTETLPLRLAAAALVGAITYWLGRRWFRERSHRGATRTPDETESTDAGFERAARSNVCSSSLGAWHRLTWLQWRQSSSMVAILTVLVAPLVIGLHLAANDALGRFGVLGRFYPAHSTGWEAVWLVDENMFLYAILGLIAFPLAGASVWAGDQRRRRFRYLAERGVAPGTVWWSRQLVWVITVLVWSVVAWCAMAVPLGLIYRNAPPDIHTMLRFRALFGWISCGIGLYACLAYSIGQFCSMLFRSAILAGTWAVVGAALLSVWATAMVVLDVNPLWSVLPIPMTLIVAGRLRTAGWMLERNTLRCWLPVAVVVAIPLTGLFAGVCLYRAFEIPPRAPEFALWIEETARPVSPEARETLNLYRRAYDIMTPREVLRADGRRSVEESPDQHDERVARWYAAAYARWVKNNSETIALALKASRRAECDPDIAGRPRYRSRHDLEEIGITLSALVARKGVMLQEQGDLDGAAEYYLAAFRVARHLRTLDSQAAVIQERLVDWSAAPNQTGERILTVLRALEEQAADPPAFDLPILVFHARTRGWIDGDLDAMLESVGKSTSELIPVLALYWLPWERVRAHRALDKLTMELLGQYRELARTLDQGEPLGDLHLTDPAPPAWVANTPIVSRSFDRVSLTLLKHSLVQYELVFRATLIQLALQAWRLDRGDLPDTLGELAGTYLTRVPLDPVSGESFVYFARGLEQGIERRLPFHEAFVWPAANQPFIWSPGWRIDVVNGGEPIERYRVDGQRAATVQEVWARGQSFPIP